MPTDQAPPPRPRWPQVILRRTDQAAAAALLAISLVAIAGWCVWQARLSGRLIDIERAEPIAVQLKIDVNEADWPELALMPGIGPQLAKRIVADRESNGRFRHIDDLDRVRGIGPRILEGMKPYLLPIEQPVAKVEASPSTGE